MITNIRNRFAETVADHDNLRAFAFFSANLHKLHPDVPYERHPALFLEANRYARLATDDQLNIRWAATYQPSAGFLEGMRQPGIIASFHTGPYRLLCMWLARMGVPLTMVIASDVAQKQTERNQRAYEQLVGGTTASGYEYLLADDPMILRKMISALKGGRFLVCYVDGHMGVGKNAQGRSTMIMDFMAHQLRVKTGAAELARLTQAPIYPVLAHFDDQDQPVLHRYDTIDPHLAPCHSRTCVVEWMTHLYSCLSTVVNRYPMQWEGWFYIHHDLVHGQDNGKGGIFQYYLPFKLADNHFLLHKESFSAFPVPPHIYQELKRRV